MSPRLNQLLESGVIARVPIKLGPRDQAQRMLFWTNEFEQWARQTAADIKSRSLVTIPEQLNLAFAEFVSGRPLSSGLAKCDPPKGEGIWRLKTPDLRLYGWADSPQCMVLALGEQKKIIAALGPPKDRDLGRAAVKERKRLGLSCVIGERHEIFPAIGGR